jgi:serine/threonine-protein kinase
MGHNLPSNFVLNQRYEILAPIGQGGFGITYKALDRIANELVCIKELFISGNSARDASCTVSTQPIGDVDFNYLKRRFLEEAQTLEKLKHAHIVKVRDHFEANGTAYMVMDFIKGKNLKEWVEERGMLEEQKALNLFCQLLDAVTAVHNSNFLHRDIKPDNILINSDEKLILIDFGTAKFNSKSTNGASTLIVVNHGYAPPEQYSSELPKDKYTDIYALGATLYFMLTGQKPIQATDRNIRELPPVKSFNPNLSQNIQGVISKAMQIKPNDRFQSVEELKNRLCNKNLPPSQPPKLNWYWVFGGVVLLVFVLLFALLSNKEGNGTSPASDTVDSTAWHSFNNTTDELRSQGYEERSAEEGELSEYVEDPDGVQHVFAKKKDNQETPVNETVQVKSVDPCDTFKKQEKALLNSGYKLGNGSSEDEKKTLTDCNGNENTYYKKKKPEVKYIKSNFKKTEPNTVVWSDDLRNNAEKITIVFNNGFKTFSQDVSGMNSYKFQSGDKDFDGVECSVELIITLKPDVKLTDTPKIKMKTHC